MGFILSSVSFSGSKQFGNIFYKGESVRVINNEVIVAKSSYIGGGEYDEKLSQKEIGVNLVDYEEFFITARYFCNTNNIQIQSDIIGFEESYMYFNNSQFIFSDSVFDIVNVLMDNDRDVSISEKKVRELLYWSYSFIGETIFTDIIRIKPSTIYEIDFNNFRMIEKEYYCFSSNITIADASIATNQLYSTIEDRMSIYSGTSYKFGLGLSGGLDSRVGAYFSQRYGLNTKAFFIGEKYGPFGLLTNDAKRSLEVANVLGIKEVEFLDPNLISWDEKIYNDLENCPLQSSNAPQNIGYDFLDVDIIINGSMGGELFGAVIPNNIFEMDERELTKHLLSYLTMIPKYKNGGKAYEKIFAKMNILKNRILLDQKVYYELISKEHMLEVEERMYNWVIKQKELGLSNVKIVMKDLYQRYSVGHKRGYYFALNNKKKALPIYLNPQVIKLMLSWDDSLFIKKKVQKEFLSMLGNLGSIRGQNLEVSINRQLNKKSGSLINLIPVIERCLRGGGMVYHKYLKDTSIKELGKKYITDSELYNRIPLNDKAWVKSLNPFLYLTYIKMCMLVKNYGLKVK